MINTTQKISKSKWCIKCGRKVDLRKGGCILSSDFNETIPNPEYRFVCNNCYPNWHKEMMASRGLKIEEDQ